jgi:hypothetical protein
MGPSRRHWHKGGTSGDLECSLGFSFPCCNLPPWRLVNLTVNLSFQLNETQRSFLFSRKKEFAIVPSGLYITADIYMPMFDERHIYIAWLILGKMKTKYSRLFL